MPFAITLGPALGYGKYDIAIPKGVRPVWGGADRKVPTSVTRQPPTLRDRGLARSAAHHPRRAALVFNARHPDSPHIAGGVPLGAAHDLWQATEQHGHMRDFLVQGRRNAWAPKRFFRKLLQEAECLTYP